MKIGLVQLGCPKNLVDAEVMLGRLAADGHQAVGAEGGAEALIVNTCGFIDAAKQESVNAILAALERKKRGEVKKGIVTGCAAQTEPDTYARMAEVDPILGNAEKLDAGSCADFGVAAAERGRGNDTRTMRDTEAQTA